jgi:electron transfer flavoprotein beta subunit
MKIVVCMKQTFDTEAQIVLTEAGRIDDGSVLLIVNPCDEHAVEEAIRLKEKSSGEVTVVTVGGRTAPKALQHCLAMGADHAILVSDPSLENADSHTYALVLSRVLKSMEYDLILCGRESIDDKAFQVPTRLAELLDLPQINLVSALKIEQKNAQARRDIEGGTEVITVDLPAVFSVQKGINEVRYPPLRRVMQAAKVPIKSLSLADVGLTPEEAAPFSVIEGYILPPARKEGRLLAGELEEVVAQLIRHLQDDAKII